MSRAWGGMSVLSEQIEEVNILVTTTHTPRKEIGKTLLSLKRLLRLLNGGAVSKLGLEMDPKGMESLKDTTAQYSKSRPHFCYKHT